MKLLPPWPREVLNAVALGFLLVALLAVIILVEGSADAPRTLSIALQSSLTADYSAAFQGTPIPAARLSLIEDTLGDQLIGDETLPTRLAVVRAALQTPVPTVTLAPGQAAVAVVPSPTPSESATALPTSTSSATPTAAATTTATPSPSATLSATGTPRATRSVTPTASASATATATPTVTPTPSASVTPSPTAPPSPTPSRTLTSTPTATLRPGVTPSATPSVAPTLTPSDSPSATPSATPTATRTATRTASPVETLTVTPPPSPTPTATPTLTLPPPTATNTLVPSATPEPPTPTPGCALTATTLILVGNELRTDLNNAGLVATTLTRLSVTWVDTPISQALRRIQLSGLGIFSGTDPNSPTTLPDERNWDGALADRQLGPNSTRDLRLEFTEPLAPGAYALTLEFDNGCNVTTGN